MPALRYGWLIAIAVTYLYVFPYFPRIHSANELPRIYLVQAIADDGTFAIDRGVERWGGTADVSDSGGHHYSNKAPGSSLLVVPVYWAVSTVSGEPSLALAMWLARAVAGIAPMLVFLWLLYGFLERYAPDPLVRRLVVVAYALGSMAMTYSILFFSHQLGAICVASAWILALDYIDGRRGLGAMAVAGALAGSALLVDYQAVFAAVPVAVHVVVRMWPRRMELLEAAGLATAAALLPVVALLLYHWACFGSPFRTGYDASSTWAGFHQKGFLGITELRWEAFWGSFFRLDNGLFALAPWFLLAIPGGIVLARKDRATVAVVGAVALIYLLFVSSINFWRGGWGVGPRYITAMLPFLLPLVAAALQALRERPLLLGAAAGPILVGVAIYTLSSATFPYWPDSIPHPLYDVTFRLLAEDLVAPNAMSGAFGITGVLGLVPYLAIVAWLAGSTLVRLAGRRGCALAVAIACAWLALYGLAPHGGREVEPRWEFVKTSVERGTTP